MERPRSFERGLGSCEIATLHKRLRQRDLAGEIIGSLSGACAEPSHIVRPDLARRIAHGALQRSVARLDEPGE
jgi:hypothetical protein